VCDVHTSMLWHPQKFLQCTPLPSIPGIISKGVIFPFTCSCTLYLHSIHPPTSFPQLLPYPTTGTKSGYHFLSAIFLQRLFPSFWIESFFESKSCELRTLWLLVIHCSTWATPKPLTILLILYFFNQCFSPLVPGIEPRVLCMLVKYTSIEMHA
jgi:hypothetical protein